MGVWREREWGGGKEALGSWGTSKAEAWVGHSSPPPTRLRINKTNVRREKPESEP